jgi:hypothetical protein
VTAETTFGKIAIAARATSNMTANIHVPLALVRGSKLLGTTTTLQATLCFKDLVSPTG